jgi:hypothetical protein
MNPPKTYHVYRGLLLAVLCGGLFLLGLVAFPAVAALVELLIDTIEGIHDSFTWNLV